MATTRSSTPSKADQSESKAEVVSTDADAVDSNATVAEEKPAAEKPSSDSPSGTRYLNVTNSFVVYDKIGHGVAGGEWVEISGLDTVGKRARARGYILPQSAL